MTVQSLTVVCRDKSNERHDYEGVLIYAVTADLANPPAIVRAIVDHRRNEIGNDDVAADDIELLFAFAGDLSPVADWRE